MHQCVRVENVDSKGGRIVVETWEHQDDGEARKIVERHLDQVCDIAGCWIGPERYLVVKVG